MTKGAVCTHCGTRNHSAAQCWTLHSELCPFQKRESALMAKVEREGEKVERAMEAELRAREERTHRYDSERHEEEESDEPDDNEMFPQYMASHEYEDEDLPKSIEYSDLLDLDDPALEAELQLLSTPIADSVDELRRLQQSSDENGGVASPEETVASWFTVGAVPTPGEDPLDPRRSPRTQKKVRISGINGTPPVSNSLPQPKNAKNPQSSAAVLQRKSAMRKQMDDEKNRFDSMGDESDPAMLPMTFPIQDMGVPVPRTTNLEEPREGLPQPPPLRRHTNDEPSEGEEEVGPMVDMCKTPHHMARMIHNELKVVTEQAGKLRERLLELAKAEEEHAPLPVLMVHNSHAPRKMIERYREAQRNSGN